MKKFTVSLLAVLLVFGLLGCASAPGAGAPVSGVSAEEAAAAAIAAQAEELGTEASQPETTLPETTAPETQAPKAATPEDVMAGGSYVVVLGDYMNSITLYYEDGVLVKIEEEFQKNSAEEAESYTYEGESLANYQFNFIDWANAPLQDILDGMKDYGSFGSYKIRAAE